MKSYRMNAVIAGALYIAGTVSGILSAIATKDIFAAGDIVGAIAANQLPLRLGAFFVFLMGISLAIMPVFLYPLFKRRNGSLALGMVIFRGPLELTAYFFTVGSWLVLGVFSEGLTTGAGAEASLQAISDILVRFSEIMTPVTTTIFFIGAMFLYILFYQTRLIPRWLSLWGIISAVPYLAVDLVRFFGFDLHMDFLYFPLAVQEIVMAFWLIAAGFNKKALEDLQNANSMKTNEI